MGRPRRPQCRRALARWSLRFLAWVGLIGGHLGAFLHHGAVHRTQYSRRVACWATGRPLLGVIGGGAAGFFAAIEAGRASGGTTDVVVLEGSKKVRPPLCLCGYSIIGPSPSRLTEMIKQVLQKVSISGGGRCNVMYVASRPV
jgi:hypothetical protein